MESSGCVEKRDIVDKIARHPAGFAAAEAAAIARGETRNEHLGRSNPNPGREGEQLSDNQGPLDVRVIANEGGGIPPEGVAESDSATPGDFGGGLGAEDFREMGGTKLDAPLEPTEQEGSSLMGMTLADYMNRPTVGEETTFANRRGQARGGGGDGHSPGKDGRDGRRAPSVQSGSSGGGRPGTGSGRPVNPRNVRVAPSHIAPPSTPAPEWVVEMQVRTYNDRKPFGGVF